MTIKNGICPNCKSREILPHVDPVGGKELTIRVYENPDVTLKGQRNFTLKAWVCANCGYTEFYVNNPHELRDSYKRYLGE